MKRFQKAVCMPRMCTDQKAVCMPRMCTDQKAVCMPRMCIDQKAVQETKIQVWDKWNYIKGIARLWLLQAWMLKIPIAHVHKYFWYLYKVCSINNSAKYNLNAINLEMKSWNLEEKKRESKEIHGKNKCHYQIYISIRVNIHRVVKKLEL